MIVWLASFPRSGNTFLRIALNRLYGVRTSTVYDVDGVARRLGADLVGFEERSETFEAMRASDQIHFIKTHRPRDDDVDNTDGAICLVRDGRDALVSWARQRWRALRRRGRTTVGRRSPTRAVPASRRRSTHRRKDRPPWHVYRMSHARRPSRWAGPSPAIGFWL